MRRLLVWVVLGGLLVEAAACGGRESAPASEVEATMTATSVAAASVVGTPRAFVEPAGTGERVQSESLPWDLPRGDESPGVLLVDWGPLRGWERGAPGAGRGALVPLDAETAEMLPGYEPFDMGHAFQEVLSPDGMQLAVAVSETQSSVSSLLVIDLRSWTELDLRSARLSEGTPFGLGPLGWGAEEVLYAERGPRGGGSGTVYALDGERSRTWAVADFDFRFWEPAQISRDGAAVYLFGYYSQECCGISVQGVPFVVAVDGVSGQELGRIELPELVIGQRHERLFDNENEYNVIRYPAVVLSPDGTRMYVVHSDDDRVTVVDLDRLVVERSVVVSRPKSVLSRLGAWVLGRLASRAEAKGGVYRMKEAEISADGRLLYVTGRADIVCEEQPSFACVDNAPFGLQIIDLESMELVHEEPGIGQMAVTSDGRWVVGVAWAGDYRGDEWELVGYGVKILDARSGELVAYVEPELRAEQVAVSPDGRFAYVVSEGPGKLEDQSWYCSEACTRIAVIEIERGEVVAERFVDGGTVRLVSLVPPR
jgi:hypothetical protein